MEANSGPPGDSPDGRGATAPGATPRRAVLRTALLGGTAAALASCTGRPVSAVAGRLERASRNFMETFPFFAVAIVLCALAGRHNWATIWGAQVYLAARVLYLPLYAFGVPGVRTLVWLVATLSIILLLVALLYPAL